uniref:Uncharacterized protein n=1 Tax=Solanum tuberosum TaxID=4113 RepID=M1C843_SOLTU
MSVYLLLNALNTIEKEICTPFVRFLAPSVLHGCKLFWIGFQELGGLLLKLFFTAFSGATIIDSFTLLGLTESDVNESINNLLDCILGGNDLPKIINNWDKNKNKRRNMVL